MKTTLTRLPLLLLFAALACTQAVGNDFVGTSPETRATDGRPAQGARDDSRRPGADARRDDRRDPVTGGQQESDPARPTLPTESRVQVFAYSVEELRNSRQELSGVEYDYKPAVANLHDSRPKVAMNLSNNQLIGLREGLGVVIGGFNLKDSAKPVYSNTAVKWEDQDSIVVEGEQFAPDSVYKIYAHFFEVRAGGTATYVGRTELPYYLATEGTKHSLAKARARIVTKAFAEWNDWELDRFDRSKGYADDPGGGWCHMFYAWATNDYIDAEYDHAYYGASAWRKHSAYYEGSQAVEFSRSDMVHGDLLGTSGHRGMLLAYDEAESEFWTIEGNFNSRVEIWKRGARSFWQGRLVESIMKPGVLRP